MFKKVLAMGGVKHTAIQQNQPVKLHYKNMDLTVHPQGAKVLEFKVDGKNVLFYDAKDLKHSGIPICFPIFGALSEPLQIGGKTYNMGQHGFLRDTDCKLEKVGKNFVTYSLTANAETLKQYPFFFKFLITYTMGKNTLKIKAQVTHLATEKGEAKMPVVLAFHPYYAVKDPGKVQVTTSGHTYFDNLLPENKKSFVKTSSLAGSKDLVHVKDNVYQVQGNPDAHIVDHQQKFTVLKPGTEDYALKLSWDKFAYLTVWRAKPDAAYVCVEPATGLKNKMVEAVNQGKKDGVIYLAKGKTQEFNLQIAVC